AVIANWSARIVKPTTAQSTPTSAMRVWSEVGCKAAKIASGVIASSGYRVTRDTAHTLPANHDLERSASGADSTGPPRARATRSPSVAASSLTAGLVGVSTGSSRQLSLCISRLGSMSCFTVPDLGADRVIPGLESSREPGIDRPRGEVPEWSKDY